MGLRYDRPAADFIAAMAPGPKRALRKALDRLARDPLGASGLDVKALRNPLGRPWYRLRVGDYRVGYEVQGRVVYVVRVFHRRDGYGWMERS
ncbi:MAG TPA: type II toxin-antitoxin system RelE/ParE family toxin [Candidatus Thermoplasmatota archaeon]|nr:type II toxin-antitoxin system RelE/ParE family toxin [Candidatus Thermoplasmatota archaeon]